MLRGLLTGGVLFLGVSLGWQLHGAWSLIGLGRAKADAVRITEVRERDTIRLSAALERDAAAARTVYRTLYREIPRHVPAQAVARCDVPVGFVRVHDAAAVAVPAVPDPVGRPDEAASGVGLDRVAVAVAGNYETCNAVRAQLAALQSWVRAMSDP